MGHLSPAPLTQQVAFHQAACQMCQMLLHIWTLRSLRRGPLQHARFHRLSALLQDQACFTIVLVGRTRQRTPHRLCPSWFPEQRQAFVERFGEAQVLLPDALAFSLLSQLFIVYIHLHWLYTYL